MSLESSRNVSLTFEGSLDTDIQINIEILSSRFDQEREGFDISVKLNILVPNRFVSVPLLLLHINRLCAK